MVRLEVFEQHGKREGAGSEQRLQNKDSLRKIQDLQLSWQRRPKSVSTGFISFQVLYL